MRALLLLLLACPVPALAHTRWFADGGLPPYITDEPTGLYLGVWTLICAVIVAVGMYLERTGQFQLKFLLPKASHAFDRAAATFSMVVGAFFLIAGTHEYLFSPNLSASSGIPMWMIVLQLAIGLSFLVGVFARVSALALLLLWLLAIPITGWVSMIEDIWVVSTALFILIMGNDYFSLVNFRILARYMHPYRSYALPILRVGTGATLLVLGFSEKILHPEFGIHFLMIHDWNFMTLMSVPYSDYLFTLSAGVVEALFGLILILGIVTRLNTLVLSVFFTIPLFILGPIELAGHLPHFAAAILILFFGSGEHVRLLAKKTSQRHGRA